MFTIERHGYNAVRDMTLDIIDDLIDNGFTVKYPVNGGGTYVQPTTPSFHVILETSSTASNIFHSTQPWRICFEIIADAWTPQSTPALGGPYILGVYLGTANNLQDSGAILKSMYVYQSGILNNEPFGNTGGIWTNKGDQGNQDARPRYTTYNEGFICRYLYENNGNGGSRPLSYRMSVTSRGLFLGTWDSRAQETGTNFNWLLVQRGVDKDTGAIRGSTPATATSRMPVFCINSVNNKIYKFVVRERDVYGPSSRVVNTVDAEDSPAPLNPEQQVSFNEDGNYVISLINNLTSPRFKYPDELDMVGTISADVVEDSQEIEISVYGEASPRKYLSLQANAANNTGMRLLVLVDNPNE